MLRQVGALPSLLVTAVTTAPAVAAMAVVATGDCPTGRTVDDLRELVDHQACAGDGQTLPKRPAEGPPSPTNRGEPGNTKLPSNVHARPPLTHWVWLLP
jgi:hypothetical protein